MCFKQQFPFLILILSIDNQLQLKESAYPPNLSLV